LIKTRLTQRFDIEHPIVCAPMALVCGGTLAAAVSRAGGLGVMGGGYAGTVGDGPGLEEQYRMAGNTPIGIGFITWAAESNPGAVDWAVEKRPKCLFLSFGSPKNLARKAVDAGVPVFCQTQTMAHVREALDAGASVIVAQGAEAGGHGHRRATFTLVPEVADLLAAESPDTLLCAAGGVGDGRGLAAARVLGADGVMVGSRLWATEEAAVPERMQAAAVAADGDGTVRTSVMDIARSLAWPEGFTARVLRNRFTDTWHGRERELRETGGEAARDWSEGWAAGDPDRSNTFIGEATGLIDAIEPAAAVIERMVAEAVAATDRAARRPDLPR
jgi:nitronate monooxygenase